MHGPVKNGSRALQTLFLYLSPAFQSFLLIINVPFTLLTQQLLSHGLKGRI
jgi:hypothetical protein